MYHVKYRDFSGKLVLLEGRSLREDAASEAEDCASAHHSEVEILVDLETADASMDPAAAGPRRTSPTERDDGTQASAQALRQPPRR
jgi:hypothetical protein